MWLPLLILACTPPDAPATTGSRSAELSTRVGRAGAEARTIAEGAATIEGDIDAWRAASPGERPAIEARIRGKAQELQDRARAVQDEVESIEAGARAFPEEPAPDAPEAPAPDAPAAP